MYGVLPMKIQEKRGKIQITTRILTNVSGVYPDIKD